MPGGCGRIYSGFVVAPDFKSRNASPGGPQAAASRHHFRDAFLNHGLITAGKNFAVRAGQLAQRHPRRITAVLAALLLGGGGGAFAFAVAALAPDAAELPVRQVIEAVEPLPLQAQAETLDLHRFNLFRSDVTRANDTADTLLKRLGLDDPAAAAFLRSDATTRQALIGRGGRNVTVEAGDDNTLRKLVARWSPDDDGSFKRLVVEKSAAGLAARLETAPLTASTRMASGTIQTSLFAATDDARLSDAVASQIADIFSGDIDFHRALRKGDRFTVVYEVLEGDGEPLRSGRVLNAEFVNAGKAFQALWFQNPTAAAVPTEGHVTHAQNKGGYYTLDGKSLRRAYLASPMAFSRVTSGFKMRFHPILQTWRAHLGVDYAAPTGTPVRSIGDGVVEFAGRQNGFGNVIFVKHGNNHTTVYAHLSRIAVKRGQSVSQGQNIGAVGATGWATGPHLHFEFRVNGAQRDPLAMARQSETVPVAAAARPQFEQASSFARQQLAAAASLQASSVQ